MTDRIKDILLPSVWICDRCHRVVGFSNEDKPGPNIILICNNCVEVRAKND